MDTEVIGIHYEGRVSGLISNVWKNFKENKS